MGTGAAGQVGCRQRGRQGAGTVWAEGWWGCSHGTGRVRAAGQGAYGEREGGGLGAQAAGQAGCKQGSGGSRVGRAWAGTGARGRGQGRGREREQWGWQGAGK